MNQRSKLALLMAVPLALTVLGCIALASQHPPRQDGKPLVPANPSVHPAPEQPLAYSHKQHLALGLQCKDCHVNPEPGKLMTYPATEKCMQCHVTVAQDKPAIQKLASFARSNEAIPWVRVYKVLPGVNWSHRQHLQANVACETCHGNVREMTQVSEVTSVVTMYSCLHCHELTRAKTSCDTCHRTENVATPGFDRANRKSHIP